MSDIRNQLIKDSYNYVLQSDLSTGVVYRIGGDIPINPIFQSGLTVTGGFTYSGAGEQVGYVMTCDAFGNATWAPTSAATPSSGVTSITVGNGLSANSSTGAVTIVFTGSTGVSGDYLPLSGGTVTGNTTFTSGLTVNYIDFDTTPNVPAPTGGTVYFDSNENALSYKPITLNNDVTVNLGQESLIRFYNDLGFQINNGQALHITGATSGVPTVSLAVGTGGYTVQFQVSGIATHDIPDSTYGFMTSFGVVRDINLTAFTVGQQVYLSQTTPGGFDSYSNLSFTGRTCEIGHVLDNSSLGKLQVTILNEIEGTIITTQENNILAANNSSTGVFQFSGLSITAPSATTFNVGAVEGWIIDNTTSPANPTIQLIIYSGSSNNTALYVSSATETYILLTSGLTLIQQTTFPTPQQRRQNLYLGKFGHGNRQFLINAFNEPDSALSPVSQLRDMFTPVKLINDGVIASANGPNLNINTSAGILYGLGIGYVTNKLNPNSLTVGGQSPATFQYRTQTGGTATNTTLIDPLNYDVGGVITPLNGVKATNQRIYLLQNGQIRIQYGQTFYNQLSAAIAALQNETFVTFPNFRDNGILIGILSVLSTATNLTDTSKAQFFSVSKFGELIGAAGGTSTTTLQQAYLNSSNPEIEINSTLDGLSIKNGTGNPDNTTQLLQGENTAGTVTSFIRADGLISGNTLSTPGFTANTNGLTATTVSATTYQNLPYTGTTNYIPKWTNTTGLTDSQIVDNGNQVYIGGGLTHTSSKFGVSAPIEFQGIQMTQINGSIAITDSDLGGWLTGGQEIAIGTGNPLAGSTGTGNIAIGYQSMNANSTGINNVAIGLNSLILNQAGQGNTALGYKAGQNINSGSYNVLIGYEAGNNLTTEDNRLYIANNTYGTLIYGDFVAKRVGINTTTPLAPLDVSGNTVIQGTLSATTYDNLPGSSSANCFTTFYVTNISGCSPVNILSPLNVKDGLSVTGTSTFTSQVNFNGGISATTFSAQTYQNLPSFNEVKINGITQFSGDTNNFINFSGINLTITSAATNTLVFSAATGGGGGTVTSVALSAGTSGTDVNISNSAITTSGTITINIPDASDTNRGLVTTGAQKFAGQKTFTSNTVLDSLTASQILALDSVKRIQSLDTATYPSLTELSYVKGVTSAIQTQLNNKFATSGGTIEGNLIVTGNTNVSGVTTSTGNLISLQNLQSLYSVGDEGGEITLAKPATNSTINGTSVTIDIYQNKLRFFESGSPNRGAYIDLTQSSPSAGSDLLSGTSISTGTGISGNSTTGAVNLQLSASSYSVLANNTAATAAPSFLTFKEVGEQAMTATITWNNTAPSGTTNLRYRWFQIGNMVQYFFFFNYGTGGLNNSTITFDFPADMPTPTPPTGTGGAGTYIYRGSGLAVTSPTVPATPVTSGFWGGGIRRDSGNTKYEFFFAVGTAIAARTFYHSGFYFV